MDGVKAFLTRQIGPFPVYAYLVGVVFLAGGVWYFKKHNKGSATVAPQTNLMPQDFGNVGSNPPPLPYPGGTTAVVPPTPVFTTTDFGRAANQSPPVNWGPWSPTTSQNFAATSVPNPSITNRWRLGAPNDLPPLAAMDPRAANQSPSAPFPVGR